MGSEPIMDENKPYQLMDACSEIMDNPMFVPADGVTHCNQAVQYVARRIGYHGFTEGTLANQMIDFLAASPEWLKIQLSQAQAWANDGHFVITCLKDEPHGHIAVVRPGISEYSQKWLTQAPKLANIGAKNSIGKGANWIFPAMPDCYVLKA